VGGVEVDEPLTNGSTERLGFTVGVVTSLHQFQQFGDEFAPPILSN
jgi:hypothetical protein